MISSSVCSYLGWLSQPGSSSSSPKSPTLEYSSDLSIYWISTKLASLCSLYFFILSYLLVDTDFFLLSFYFDLFVYFPYLSFYFEFDLWAGRFRVERLRWVRSDLEKLEDINVFLSVEYFLNRFRIKFQMLSGTQYAC